MKRIFTSFYILLCFISVNAIAEIDSGGQVDFSSIEEQERRQIISELTYHLDIKQTCDQTLSWDDSGSVGTWMAISLSLRQVSQNISLGDMHHRREGLSITVYQPLANQRLTQKEHHRY